MNEVKTKKNGAQFLQKWFVVYRSILSLFVYFNDSHSKRFNIRIIEFVE